MLMIDQPDEQTLIRNLSNANARLTKALTALTAERDAERALADALAECLAEMTPADARDGKIWAYRETVAAAQAALDRHSAARAGRPPRPTDRR